MFNDAAMTAAANTLEGLVTHMQLHSTAVGGAWGTNAVGARVAVNGTVDADGDITWADVAFTGLDPNQAVGGVSYWSASVGGTNYGGSAIASGDVEANAAGEYTVTVTEPSTAS